MKIILIAALQIWILSVSAQTQHGYVKTLGRPNKPGIPLSGVSIRFRGLMNQVLSDEKGYFSIQMPDKKEGDAIILQGIRKNGYELKDRDLIGRPLVFSSRVPIEIVLISSEELAENKRRIEKKAYQVVEQNYQNKLKNIKKQLERQELTIDQYRQQLQDLEDKFEKYQMLIGEMADRYARTDYDHLDSIDQEINLCIENGELDKADSLIHTVFDPNTVLERNRAAKAEIQAKMDLAQRIIDKVNADREAILRDREYALQIATLSENLAKEYISQGEIERAKECLKKSLIIKELIYGEKHSEVDSIKTKYNNIIIP